MLERGSTRPLTLVSAPAGTGKTMLVADWASSRDPDLTAWITFESGDGQAPAFWSSVFAQLQMHGVSAAGTQPAPNAGGVPTSGLLEVAAGVSARAQPLTLVLDGWEFVTDSVAGDFDFLLRHGGGKLNAVIATRSDPVLPLHRYRLNNTMTEVRIADLAFTTDEVRALAQVNGLTLTEQSLDALAMRTRGWAAGLRFAMMYLEGQADPDEGVLHLAGDTGNIAEYLVAEVLEMQSEADRELLLSTCIVDSPRPGLIEELGGPGATRGLSRLAHGNAFLETVADHPGWYRYHPFFREMLRAELEFLAPDTAIDLHGRASRWFAANGMLGPAVRHAAEAQQWAQAAQYVVDDLALGAVLQGSEHEQVSATLSAMPRDVSGAAAAIVRAGFAISRGDTAVAQQQLEQARSIAVVERSDDRLDGSWESNGQQIANWLIASLLSLHDPDAAVSLEITSDAESELERQSPARLAAHPELVAMLMAARATALTRAGQVEAARKDFTAAAGAAEAPGCESTLVYCLSHLALLDALQGALRLATDRATRALALVERADFDTCGWWQAASLVALCWVSLQQGDTAAARKRIAEVSARGGIDTVLPDTLHELAEARLASSDGDFGRAIEITLGVRERAVTSAPWVAALSVEEEVTSALARGDASVGDDLVRALSGRHDTGAALTRARIELHRRAPGAAKMMEPISSRPTETLMAQVTAGLLAAEGELQRGDSARARASVERASHLAAPEGLWWPFQVAPPAVRRLLPRQHVQSGGMGHRPSDDRARRHPVQAVPGPHDQHRGGAPLSPDSPAPVIEALTVRELEVLNHLSELLTTEEIAATMFVSVNTVRTHVRSILRKLSVSRRHQAVRRARALDILSDA
jgi:LuxR family maltose regulon positive regulatory protein